jgi:hypothetical protein
LERFAELVEGRCRRLVASGYYEVVAGSKRQGRDDGAEAAADAVAGHGVAYSFPDGVADAVVSQAVGPYAEAEEPVAYTTAILQYRDEVLAAAKPFGAREGLRRYPGPR